MAYMFSVIRRPVKKVTVGKDFFRINLHNNPRGAVPQKEWLRKYPLNLIGIIPAQGRIEDDSLPLSFSYRLSP
jgi:hypothetical protein